MKTVAPCARWRAQMHLVMWKNLSHINESVRGCVANTTEDEPFERDSTSLAEGIGAREGRRRGHPESEEMRCVRHVPAKWERRYVDIPLAYRAFFL